MHNGLELVKNAIYKVFKKAAKIPITFLVIIIVVILIVLMVLGIFQTKKDDSKYVEGSWESVPYAASQYTSNVSIGKDGKITSSMSAKELWDKLIENGARVDEYLDGPEELLKLMNAEVVTNYPDTRSNPDEAIDWDKLNKDVNSKEVQGIIKFRRAKSDGSSARMTYVNPDTFYGWIEQYNETGDESIKEKILEHFTIKENISYGSIGTSNLDYSTSDIVTNISEAIVQSAKTTPSPGAGWCEAWAETVYRNVGLAVPYYATAYDAYKACVISTETNNIPVGAAVFGTGSGSYAGHVGIYIGNGLVMDNVGSINTSTLEEWIEWQEGNPTELNESPGWLGWGWLCEEPTQILSGGDKSSDTNEEEETEDDNKNDSDTEASFTKYSDLTESQIRGIASLCKQEQGTVKGAAAEASLMANLFELRGSSYGQGGSGLYNYVRNSGWFANAASFMDSGSATADYINAVRTVLVEGKRTLPGYIDEHDCFTDIASATNNGASINVSDRTQYQSHVTKLNNVYGSSYTFYSFPDTNSDPFGYTSEANRQRIGDGHYEFSSGEFTSGDGTTATQTTSYQVIVATWNQVDTTVTWSDSDMASSHSTRYTMNTQSINYQDFISEYKMPFDYLWALTVMGNDPGIALDLADLVLNSEIEITVHDNLTVTTNKVVEEFEKRHVTVEDGKSRVEIIKYYKTTTTTTRSNTLKIALTTADVWIVDYSQKFTYQQNGESNTYVEQPAELKEKIDSKSKEPNFVTIFNDRDNYQAKNSILGGADWLFEILKENKNTVDMIDLTKYLFYVATGQDFGVKDYDFGVFDPKNFTSTSGIYGNTIEEKVWFALRGAGYSEIATAAVMGNINNESGFEPSKIEAGSGIGLGLCQWSFGRRDSLEAYMASKGVDSSDVNTQIEFLLGEISPTGGANGYATFQMGSPSSTSYDGRSYTYYDWKDATDLRTATMAFMTVFERPSYDPGTNHIDRRIEDAQRYYNEFKGKTAPTGDGQIGEIKLTGENANKMRAMLTEAIRIAEDDSYTYSQSNRYGQYQYDCSSLVARLYQEFFEITVPNTTYGYSRSSSAYVGADGLVDLQPGDVLYRDGHVEIYLGNGLRVGAHSSNLPVADQISIKSYSAGYFTDVYRFVK